MPKLPQSPKDFDLSNLPKGTRLSHYRITNKPIKHPFLNRLPKSVKDAIQRLRLDSQAKPHQAIPELQELISQYPQVPIFYNYLAIAYSLVGQPQKAETVTLDCLKRHPDYLFARLNYAEFCLARKEYDKIPELFDHNFDLKMLYPHRNSFHITEVTAFMAVMGIYFAEIGQPEIAAIYNEALQQIAPDSPLAKRLENRLN